MDCMSKTIEHTLLSMSVMDALRHRTGKVGQLAINLQEVFSEYDTQRNNNKLEEELKLNLLFLVAALEDLDGLRSLLFDWSKLIPRNRLDEIAYEFLLDLAELGRMQDRWK